jgi:serpin B
MTTISRSRWRLVVLGMALVTAACGAEAGSPSSTAPAGATYPSSTSPSSIEPEVLAVSEGVVRAEPASDAPVAELAVGFNTASFSLWRRQLLEGNLVFSPASIGHALLMARAAADQTTGAAIDRAFGLPAGAAAHQAWNAIDRDIARATRDFEQGELAVGIADRIWPRLDVQPDQGWVDLLAAEHGVTTRPLDLTGDPEGSREVINDWVGEQTRGLIPELLPEGFIHGDTVLVLTDALYFAARWEREFGKCGPVAGTFTRLDGSTVEVEFMQELELADRRGRGDGFVGAEIPYVGRAFSMLLIIPDEGRFAEVRDRLDQGLLDEIDAAFTTGPYELLMPGWADKAQLDLMDWLAEIGAAPGSYPGITSDAFLDGSVHAADITVDEWGTVAAAASGLGFAESGPPEPELTVAADQPFLYLIRHRSSGLILFAGQVTDPTA